jgi:macrolide transport system ATP-binding/permease protein
MALGADRSGVITVVLRSALFQSILGLAIGVPVAFLRVRYVECPAL